MENQQNNSKISLWSGWILKGLLSLFFLMDGIMKIIKHPQYVKGTLEMGLPESSMTTLGLYMVVATVLYLLPRTTILGGLLLTAYLGGAVAITYSLQKEGHPYLFPIVFAILLWAAEFLRSKNIRSVLPFTSNK